MAKFDNTEKYRLAKIVATTNKEFYRKRPSWNKQKIEEEGPVRYYVHFLGEDRRLDDWVMEDAIRLDIIETEQALKEFHELEERMKDNQTWENNENQNMDER